MKFNHKHNIHNIPLKVRMGCLGLLIVLIFISIVIFVGFFQVMSFLLESWIGIFFLVLIIFYFIYKKIIPKFHSDKTSDESNNNFTEADYIEIDDSEEDKK